MERNFWWGDGVDKKKFHTIKRNELCKHSEEGGLGIRKSKENNLALLAKIVWRCLTNEKLLCTNIIKAKYCPIKSLWEAKFKTGNSRFWRGFVHAVDFINDYIGWAIGDGTEISVWESRWIPCDHGLRKPLSPISNPDVKIKDLWNDSKTWNIPLISDAFGNCKDVEDITKIYLSYSELNDEIIWPFTKDGNISTKSAYKTRPTSNTNSNNDLIKW